MKIGKVYTFFGRIFYISEICVLLHRKKLVMRQIKNETAYRAALKRIDELLPLTGDNVPDDDPNMLEMDMLCDMVEEYENVHYPIGKPELPM